MIKKKRDIRKIKIILPAHKSANFQKFGFSQSVRLIQFLEKSRIIRGVVNKHFHSYNLLSPAGMRAFFSGAAAQKQLSRIYESFYQQKLEMERRYYKSKPTMTYKMLKSFFDYDYQKETVLIYRKAPPAPEINRQPANYEARKIEPNGCMFESREAAVLTESDLAVITENVLRALTQQRLREERRKGK